MYMYHYEGREGERERGEGAREGGRDRKRDKKRGRKREKLLSPHQERVDLQ